MRKKVIFRSTASMMATACVAIVAILHLPIASGSAFDVSTISNAAGKAVEWTFDALRGTNDFEFPNERSADPRTWVQGAALVGLKDWAVKTKNENIWNWLKDFAEEQDFQLGKRDYHADDHVVGQYYIALADHFDLPEAIEPTVELLDSIIASPSKVSLNHTFKATGELKEKGYSRRCQTRWCWADALFMSPPTFVQLSKALKDDKYIKFADKEFWVTADYLFRTVSEAAPGYKGMPGGLFLRDDRFFKSEPGSLDDNGNLIFWGRGNGWVLAGIKAILESMPEDFKSRSMYEELFRKMAAALVAVQVDSGKWKGFWGPSLLAFNLFPTGESSGTAFLLGGLAWGVSSGVLEADEFLPVVKAAWEALLSVQRDDGSIGYTQQIGFGPDKVEASGVQLYGAGAFLNAACGMLTLAEKGLL